MKTKYLLLGAIFAFFALSARAQVYEMYSQGFESGEPATYSGAPATGVRYSTSIHSVGGNRALKLVQSSTDEIEVILDTIDFTQNTTLRYIALRFDHICRVPKNSPSSFMMARIYYKRAQQTDWTAMTTQEYNVASGVYSSQFTSTNSFSAESYDDWLASNVATVSNNQWHSERFDLDNLLTAQVPANERKVLIKFVLYHRTLTTPLDTSNVAWWIDNIRVSASAERMVTPKITMYEYPTVMDYPNSRGAHIDLSATTSVTAGIDPDSVYLFYRGGSESIVHRLPMTPVPGVATHYECRIPYYGYDTLMHFYCVARDATGNSNKVVYPSTAEDDANTWITYRCVRGSTSQPGLPTPEFTGTSSTTFYPFPADADHRCEIVFDSALLRAAGYGPGAITSLRFMVASSVNQARTDPRFQIKMKNVPANYTVTQTNYAYRFTTDAMQIVYDSALTIPVMPSNLEQTIVFQDTFFYSGNDIIMQITYDGTVDHSEAIDIKTIPTTNDKLSFYFWHGYASYGFNPFTAEQFRSTVTTELKRPAFVFYESPLQPLLYDAGISELVDPNFDVPMTVRPGSITVKLKNHGANDLNTVHISYTIDDTLSGSFVWQGVLAGGAETNVTIANNIDIPAGFHNLCVWNEDTVASNGQQYRDHEPYNNSICSAFIVCDGPMNGVRNIGGPNAHFNNIEEFLFSLSRCGVNDSLIVRLAPGLYPSFTMPTVPGVSTNNYIVFESLNPASQAVLYADSTMEQTSIVNLEAIGNIRFRNLIFRRDNGPLTDMVTLGQSSFNCQFKGCTFTDMLVNPVAALRINSMINSGNANNMLVDSCVFNGGNVGVTVRGAAPDNYSSGVVIRKNVFYEQYSNAVKIDYMSNVTVVDNEMYDVLSNSSYVLLLNGCDNAISVERNKIYTSRGAGALALSTVNGTSSNRALIANNMIVSADDGTANQLTTPVNVIQGTWIDVVYNSVKLVAPTRVNVAAVTFGIGVTNSRFMNNIVAALDNTNYAFNYQHSDNTVNTITNNDYFTNGTVINRWSGSSYTSMENWRTAMPNDTVSVSVNPNFIDSTLVDLRTYNRSLKGIGLPMATVPIDIYGNPRGDTATCPGAYEFSSLPYDFEIEALISPVAETCNMPSSVELVVRMRNNGISVYDSTNTTPLLLACRVNNNAVHTITINETIPADDTVTIHTGYMLSLPSASFDDAVYTIRLWNTYIDDPNQSNDTNVFTVISRYHPAAPADIVDSIDYATSDTITPTVGINTWQVYGNTGAPHRPSQIYWYHDSTDVEPFYVGPSYITGTLYQNQQYYIRQRRAIPIVRITQVEILHGNNAAGVTTPSPLWLEGGRKAAVQLTNIGDATAYLEGDTLMTVSPSQNLNDKVYTFGNVAIEPGHSLVIQYASDAVTDSSVTLRAGFNPLPTFSYNSNVAFVYKRNGVVEDALPLNGVITTSSTQSVTWAGLNVPSYVWNGAALTFQNNTAGVIRTGFNGGVGDWELSSATYPMFLASTNEDWVWYRDYGCEGDMASVTVALRQLPTVDISVTDPVVPESGCALGVEPVVVTVSNYGSDTVSNVVLSYCAGGDTITDTVTGIIPPFGDTVYTFSAQMNYAFDHDTTITLRVWTDADPEDPFRFNDTSWATVVSLFTPVAPMQLPDDTVQYATRDTITHIPTLNNVVPVWYDFDFNPVDTGYTHITELLYANGQRGMSYVALVGGECQIGYETALNANTAYPSPYQASSNYAKQQFLYSASDLAEAGAERGNLTGISFYLDTIVGSTASVTYLDYTISLGLTSDIIFTGNNAGSWKNAPDVVFSRDTLTLYQDDDHAWVSHPFDTPFFWDGVSTVVVQVTYHVPNKVTSGIKTRYTSQANTTLHKNQDQPITATTASLSKGNSRPNVKFATQSYGCEGPMTPFNVTLIGMPEHDVAIFADFDTLVYNSCDTIALPVKVRNQGGEPIDSLVIYYYLDAQGLDSTVVIDSFAPGHMYDLTFLDSVLLPGRHYVTAIVSIAGDSISSNDTVRGMFTVRFCGGDYTIAVDDATADYHSFGAAIDTLNQVGVVGPVTFLVSPGTYNEQVVLNNVDGSSNVNSINFVGQGENVLLTASTSQAANYVMMIDGASNVTVENLRMEARPVANNVNFANALVLLNDSNIHITDCYFKVKGTIFNAGASCIVLQGNVSDLTITGSETDSGYYAIKTSGLETNYSTFHIHDNIFRDFASGGINIRGIDRINITHNEIRSGNSANGRGLIGIYLANTTDTMVIQKNGIYLVDERNSAKRGIQLENVVGTVISPALVVNNMVSTHSTNSSGGLSPAKSAGIWIDSMSSFINVYYNSFRVRGNNAINPSNNVNEQSYAFWCGTTPTQISVMNNIISNFGLGYAYYVSMGSAIASSNYNAFWTEAEKKFAWGSVTNLGSLSELQTESGKDGISVDEKPYFIGNYDLHLTMTNFAGDAQYNPDVVDDIDGNSRLPLGPTIGAHEKYCVNHDMAVVDIIKPSFSTTNVETDSVLVLALFNNNGLSNESNVYWYAYIEGYEAQTMSAPRDLGTFTPSQMKYDSVMIPTTYGIIDTQRIHVVVVCNNDQSPEDNEKSDLFNLNPAFNLQALGVTADNIAPGYLECRRHNNEIKIHVKNAGSKPFAIGDVIKIGYHAEVTQPSNLYIPTMPDFVEEYVTLTAPFPTDGDQWFTFTNHANLYPTDTNIDIKVRLKGWVNFNYDITQSNDTTYSSVYNSNHTPTAPYNHDTTLAYGTWGAVRATQAAGLTILWHRDSNSVYYFPDTNHHSNSTSNYNLSRLWNNTPQYFSDSTYYLCCITNKGCSSYFRPIHVSVAPRKTRDMAVEQVLAPLGERVYMENDTVRIQIANYGTAAQSNFPITYQLMMGNNVLQTVTETVTDEVAPGDTYIYTFDTLLVLDTTGAPISERNYKLNVWTDLTNDATRRNDTLRTPYPFKSRAQNLYKTFGPNNPQPSEDNTQFDITRVAFNGIDLDIPPMDRSYTDLADIADTATSYPVLHVTRGTTDSIIIQVTQLDVTEEHFRCRGTVMIDFDRSGDFSQGGTCNETLLNGEVFYTDSTLASVITIPPCASLGYMRMRVKVMGYSQGSTDGHIIDFLLFVDENPPIADLALTQIVAPRDRIIRDETPRTVTFRMANRGGTPVNNVDIYYSFVGDTIDSTASGVIHWNGILDAGQSTVVSLPPHVFPHGTSTLAIWHNMESDCDSTNNRLDFDYHRFIVTRVIVVDSFDFDNNWYAPRGYSKFDRNYWQRTMPSKPHIDTCYSGDFAWVTVGDSTDNSKIKTGKRGSVSYLYSPIINIAEIKPDTISFRLNHKLANGSGMYVEYFNYERKWVKLEHDSAGSHWYGTGDDGHFAGTSSNNVTPAGSTKHPGRYFEYCFSANKTVMTSEFNENLQFRFVYFTPEGPSIASAFDEGCALDNFQIGRARAKTDAGIVAITQPQTPKYGQTIYPEVVIKNYGYDTLRNVRVGYTHYSNYMARYTDIACNIAPDSVDTFLCVSPFIITSDYPDTFHITAFTTISADKYRNNDTLTQYFPLSPLDNDISAEELIAPLDHVVAGDTSVRVTLRVRNFGVNPISTATASYIINGITRFDEEIDFVELLGHPLPSLEYYNYTFHHRITAPMGMMNITAIIKSSTNDYIYNDTVSKRIEGIMSITDLAAAAVIVDSGSHNGYRIALVIDNVGARGANNFEVGFWIDNDTSTMVRETYYRALPIPALSTGYYIFNTTLPDRSSGYRVVSGFVHINGDNDCSNDTTDVRAIQFIDIEVLRVLVEENANNDCRVFLELRNNGNVALLSDQQLRMRAVVNGSDSNITNINRRVDPGEVIHLMLNRRIPKSPTRHYVGTGYIRQVSGDNNIVNDQTSIVDVVNYVEDVPSVNGDKLVLEQNYPNPFTQQTTIPFTLPNAARVNFFVMDAMGHIVHREEYVYPSGSHYLTVDMEAYAAGVYYYGIEVNGQRQMRKMILR